VFVEHTTGIHGQLEDADKRRGINTSIGDNSWESIYAGALQDLELIIRKGSDGGNEAGSSIQVGIAKILKAYTLGIATDIWGRVPSSEALQGNANRTPKYDEQQSIYTGIQTLLDEAIASLAAPQIKTAPGDFDLIYGGDKAKWTKAAWSLKARYYNHLSRRDPQGSATQALQAAANGFTGPQDDLTFAAFNTASTGEHPWYQESNDRGHHAVSVTIYNLLTDDPADANDFADPRAGVFFTEVGGEIVPAPNGTAISDQSGSIYSRASANVVYPNAPMPLMTFDELKFIEAEAHLRLNNFAAANQAYQAGVTAALTRQAAAADANAYLAQPAVMLSANDPANLARIITQKYIAFWLFQPIEAYTDYRRTGFPQLSNPIGPAPRRFPYAQAEYDANEMNTPRVPLTNDVWFVDGSED
jgi:Starch-binding associating with outer membrane